MTDSRQVPGFDDLTEIGRGGFGVVYRAPQPGFGRDVAIKVLTLDATQLDSVARRRFNTETTTTGRLSTHPHIVTLHQTGLTEGGRPYLVMAYMQGGSLGQRLAKEGPLSWDEATAIAIKIAGALGTAHRAGIIHRDVKPDNIMMDEFGAPVLGDFGIASVTTGEVSTMTATGRITGTVAYSPPELLDGRRPGELTDVFALAATTFALIVGHAPFVRPDDESFTQVVARMMRDEAPRLEEYGVAGPVADAIARGLARSPEARTHSVVRFGQDLQDARRRVGAAEVAMVLPEGSTQGAAEERTLALPAVAAQDTVPPTLTPPSEAHPTLPQPVPTAAQPVQIPVAHPPERSYAFESGRPTPPARSGTPGWGVVLLSLVVLAGLAAGGLFVALDRQDGSAIEQAIVPGDDLPTPEGATDPTSAPAVPPASIGPVASPATPTATPPGTATPTATATPEETPTATPTPAAGIPVDVVAAHPDAESLASVLGRWGAGINEGAYDSAFDLYSPALRERVTFARFQEGNSTSTISDAQVVTVTEDGTARDTTIRFQSDQSAEFGPDDQTCSRWELIWRMVPAGAGDWLVDDVDAREGFPQAC